MKSKGLAVLQLFYFVVSHVSILGLELSRSGPYPYPSLDQKQILDFGPGLNLNFFQNIKLESDPSSSPILARARWTGPNRDI